MASEGGECHGRAPHVGGYTANAGAVVPDDFLPKSEESKDEHNNNDQTDQIDDGVHSVSSSITVNA